MSHGSVADPAWSVVLAAGAMADALERNGEPASFVVGADGGLDRADEDAPARVLSWQPGEGWRLHLGADDPRSPVLGLYLPLCSATAVRPMTLGHLGQSLDGFIATTSGDSQYVTGPENMVHMHRLRALSDAVLVGAGTVAADDPQLTTRLITGPHPLRVVVDPERRLAPTARVFTDTTAPTVYACARRRMAAGETHVGAAEVLAVDAESIPEVMREVVAALRARGCARIFVEGGGVTVSTLLEASLLDRLQVAVAPMFIGEGRPGIRMAPAVRLSACQRPAYRVFRMGGDVLFDCDLRAAPTATAPTAPVARIL